MPTTQNTVIDTVTFDKTQLCIIDHDGKPWLTASDLAKALGYSRTDQISRLYRNNSDEFTCDMHTNTETVFSLNNGGCSRVKTRIFSPRGCHLIAMFARTEKAKMFRKWVLDVLENYQFGDGHGAPVYEMDEPHTLDGSLPNILPIKFNGEDIPFTFYGGRYWLNAYNLGRLLGIPDNKCNKKVKDVWYRNKDDMPEDGSRLITWSRVGRTSGERVFDLNTSSLIATKSRTGECAFETAVWLHSLSNELSNQKYLPSSNSNHDHIIKARTVNRLIADYETGERSQLHEIIDGFLTSALASKN